MNIKIALIQLAREYSKEKAIQEDKVLIDNGDVECPLWDWLESIEEEGDPEDDTDYMPDFRTWEVWSLRPSGECLNNEFWINT